MGASLAMIDKHYGHPSRDGCEHAVRFLDAHTRDSATWTPGGRECHATGGNSRAALLAGVRTSRVTFECFLLASLFSGLVGVVSVMILGASSPSVGLGSLLPAFAGAFLGATAIRPGRFNAVGTTVSIFGLAAGITGLQMLGAQFYVEALFNGGALLIGITLAAVVARRRGAPQVI
jgi:ribose transport system permease protein